jgi:hypothetical protein
MRVRPYSVKPYSGRENRPLVKFAPRNDAVGLEIAQML